MFLSVPLAGQISTGKDTALSALIFSEGVKLTAGFPAGCAGCVAGGVRCCDCGRIPSPASSAGWACTIPDASMQAANNGDSILLHIRVSAIRYLGTVYLFHSQPSVSFDAT